MPLNHDQQSRKAANIMLEEWRSGNHLNGMIDSDIFLTRSQANFPSPDECFYSPSKENIISMEFKPAESETPRGILTGLGQTIAYLNKHGASYLVIPDI
ncbi:hypothetical protein K8R62_01900, partial [bacterium]|nr:hypothetical protein [bacterium]